MTDSYYLFFIFLFALALNYFFKKRKLLCSFTGDIHQRHTSKENVPLVGGIIIYFFVLKVFFNEFQNLQLFLFLILLIGIFSDLKLIKSANKRLVYQLIIIFFCVFTNKITILNTGVSYLDIILTNSIFNYIFVTFCILIILNGTNFTDGLNTLVIGYYLIVLFFIYKLNLFNFLNIDPLKIILLGSLFLFIFFTNLFNKLYLGDSGSYLLGFLFSIILIRIYYNYQGISSFYIVLLLWYPAFENLFSFLRKNLEKKSPLEPDKKHLHQLIFNLLKKKYKLESNFSNILTAQLINIYNFFIIYLASTNIYNSQLQILLITLNIVLYIVMYVKLVTFIFGNK